MMLEMVAREFVFFGASPQGVVDSERPRTPMRMIGAGLGRTGTSSLVGALKQLGYTPYHMKEGVVDKQHHQQWARLIDAWVGDAKEKAAAMEAVIDLMAVEGFDATTDYPACLIFEELMVRYPEAKVVLSVRSSGETWAKSVLQTIGGFHGLLGQRPFSFTANMRAFAKVGEGVFPLTGVELHPVTRIPEAASLAKAHDDWIEHVRKVVPPERLLVHQFSDGFGPLCEILKIPASACPAEYPRLNDTAVMKAAMMTLQIVSWIWVPVLLSILGLGVQCLRCCLCSSTSKVHSKDQ